MSEGGNQDNVFKFPEKGEGRPKGLLEKAEDWRAEPPSVDNQLLAEREKQKLKTARQEQQKKIEAYGKMMLALREREVDILQLIQSAIKEGNQELLIFGDTGQDSGSSGQVITMLKDVLRKASYDLGIEGAAQTFQKWIDSKLRDFSGRAVSVKFDPATENSTAFSRRLWISIEEAGRR